MAKKTQKRSELFDNSPLGGWETNPGPEVQKMWGDNLRSWRSLARFLASPEAANGEHLRVLLVCEQHGRARPQMMRRIITRLATLERNRLYKLLNIKAK